MRMVLVRDLMSTPVITAQPEASIIALPVLLTRHQVSQLPIVTPANRLLGIITQRDLKSLRWHERYSELKAGEVMSKPVITISPDAPAERAGELLNAYHFHALPVVVDEQVVGIISISDILRYFRHEAHQGVLADLL